MHDIVRSFLCMMQFFFPFLSATTWEGKNTEKKMASEFRKFAFFTHNQCETIVSNNCAFLRPALYTGLFVFTPLQGRFLYTHFIDEQTEAWQGSVTVPLMHGRAGTLCLQRPQCCSLRVPFSKGLHTPRLHRCLYIFQYLYGSIFIHAGHQYVLVWFDIWREVHFYFISL